MLLDRWRHLHVPALRIGNASPELCRVLFGTEVTIPTPLVCLADLNDDLDGGTGGGDSRDDRRRSERIRPSALQSLLVCTKAGPVCRCDGAGLGNQRAMLRARRSAQDKSFAAESSGGNHRADEASAGLYVQGGWRLANQFMLMQDSLADMASSAGRKM